MNPPKSFLPEDEMNKYKLGVSQLNSKKEQVTQMFSTFVTNLAEKGETGIIKKLGDTLGVSVDTSNPDKLIDEFNSKLRNPEEQLKLLEMVQGIDVVAEPALKAAIDDTIKIFEDTSEKLGKQAIKVGVDVSETLPVVGEVIAGTKALLDVSRAGIAAADAVAEETNTAVKTVEEIKKNIQEKGEQLSALPSKIQPNISIPTTNFRPNIQMPTNLSMPTTTNIRQNIQIPTSKDVVSQIGGKKYKTLKKMQINAMKRISEAFQDFNGTRKKQKGKRTKTRIPKLNVKTRKYRK